MRTNKCIARKLAFKQATRNETDSWKNLNELATSCAFLLCVLACHLHCTVYISPKKNHGFDKNKTF